jgi:hypothetical protein
MNGYGDVGDKTEPEGWIFWWLKAEVERKKAALDKLRAGKEKSSDE